VRALSSGVLAGFPYKRLSGALISASACWACRARILGGCYWRQSSRIQLKVLPAGGFVDWSKIPSPLWFARIAGAGAGPGPGSRAYALCALRDHQVQREDFIRTARAKGLTAGKLRRPRMSATPSISVVTILGIQLHGLLVGAIL